MDFTLHGNIAFCFRWHAGRQADVEPRPGLNVSSRLCATSAPASTSIAIGKASRLLLFSAVGA